MTWKLKDTGLFDFDAVQILATEKHENSSSFIETVYTKFMNSTINRVGTIPA